MESEMNDVDRAGRWADVDFLLQRASNLGGADFDHGPFLRDFMQSEGLKSKKQRLSQCSIPPHAI